jgi:ABC-type bacteriocin/lantibiotic exporter with double-glycine peptidase domain
VKQTNDYNCGSAAISYFLKLHELPQPPIDAISAATGCEPNRGTKPERVEKLLSGFLPVKAQFDTKELKPEAIVIYLADFNQDQSGHYGVVTKLIGDNILLFNPWTGKIEATSRKLFEFNWRTPWYGSRWMLTAI